MKLNENITYEKMGNDLYIMVESERFVLDNDVAIDIFDLLKAESTKENIKAFVRALFRSFLLDRSTSPFVLPQIHLVAL
ncbi:hypothetical protein PM729_14915, partial [Enterococcus mundtii]|uniref:hypothetical protein n=1 Tax=Enterococcus mundtii TaxID=53346 RepID=UPI0023309F6E